ncbi:ferric reductase like transmembrane component-domain-containing protein [Lactifluus subvellereus]|nr:ferric reductase like transmembrane component-domain-containing protein [Lactifluus subvellereus]
MSLLQSFTATSHHQINVLLFVFHIDVLLFILFALYVASTLPRALVRLFHPSEFLNGLFLRSGPSRAPHTLANPDLMRSASTRTNHSTRTLIGASEDPKSPENFQALVVPRARGFQKSKWGAPTRVPRWTTIVHPTLAYALNFRVSPGFSFGKLVVLLTYAIVVLYACWLGSDPFTDPLRTGYVAVSQIPIVIALAGKTNWLSWVSGVGYEKLNYIHRFAGRAVVVMTNVHALGYIYKWSLDNTVLQRLRDPNFVWGLVAVGALDLLFACSLSFVRNRMYTLFFMVHVFGAIIFLFGTYFHAPTTFPFLLAAVGVYVFDHLARLARTRYTTAWLTAEPALNGGTTLVHVPSLGAGWRAGQHVRLRVVSNAWLGWWAAWLGRARPFTIATGSGSRGMIIPVKANGSWTRNLLSMASEAADARPGGRSMDTERGRGPAREVRVIVEGPYSGPGYTLYSAYSGAVLVAGGSGISYVMSVLDDMLHRHASGKSHLRVIEVIWSITDSGKGASHDSIFQHSCELMGCYTPDSLYSLLPELMPLMQPRASPHAAISLRFNVHWTRASARPHRVPRTALPPGMVLRAGRPDIYETLRGVIAGVRSVHWKNRRGGSSDGPSGVVIGSCGPTALIDDAARAVGRVSWVEWKAVGGVESIEEYACSPTPLVVIGHVLNEFR